jgi:hypothetical protein
MIKDGGATSLCLRILMTYRRWRHRRLHRNEEGAKNSRLRVSA